MEKLCARQKSIASVMSGSRPATLDPVTNVAEISRNQTNPLHQITGTTKVSQLYFEQLASNLLNKQATFLVKDLRFGFKKSGRNANVHAQFDIL